MPPATALRRDLLARASVLDPARLGPRRRSGAVWLAAVAVAVYVAALVVLKISPLVLARGMWRLLDMVGLMLPPNPQNWAHVWLYTHALIETLSIALLGTLGAALVGFCLSFFAARNVVANVVLHFLARRGLDAVRSVDTLIWALIWVTVVGLGPFAGVLAILCSDMAAFGKLFSETIETADRRPIEGVVSAGGTLWHRLRFGILPQVLPVFASQVLYFFESNTRSATIIGVVGAGGIGLQLYEQIRVLEWQQVSFLIAMILVTVAVIDHISGRLRAALMGRR
jgi:phosphonate transport system permease protein